MRHLFRHIILVFLGVLGVSGISSCVNEHYDLEEDGLLTTDGTTLVLRLNTVNSYKSRADVADVERINSLRIVITDATDKVEINRYFGDVSSRDFYSNTENLFIIPNLTPGSKNVYIFANEESVPNISWTQTDNFGEYVNSVTFPLNQDKINTSGLPYSASYYNINILEGQRNEFTCYLVPVCTKFRFKFFNDRSSAVQINSISLSSQANSTYLMAHVEESDFYKSLPGESEKKYWIDWLYEISNDSWNYPGIKENEWFNGRAGYIKAYNIPTDKHSDYTFSNLSPSINSSSSTDFYGPYYVMESKYVNDSGEQKYYLNFNINGAWPQPDPVELKDFPALFRNSFVDIDVLLSGNDELDISLYYTVCDWENQTSGDITFN